LDTFFVTDARSGAMVDKEGREKFEDILLKVLTTQIEDLHPLIAKQKLARPLYQSLEGERIPLRIQCDNDSSETRSVIDLETEDRLGLLYAISQVFTDLNLDLSLAKISTEKGAAIDTFYVCNNMGEKIYSPEHLLEIERGIRKAVTSLDFPT
jgi:[protein-PII] uridylyltransferase